MPDKCWAQWERLSEQCWIDGEYSETPYLWTDDCDMLIAFDEAWCIWYEVDDLADIFKLQREHYKVRNQARKAIALAY